MPTDINPQEFGELVAHVQNLRERSTEHTDVLNRIMDSQTRMLEMIHVRNGEIAQQQRYNAGFVTIISVVVSGTIAAAIEWFKAHR